MKIALMTNNYKPFMGGVPISVERLAKGLSEQGHQVTVFAPTYQNQTKEDGVFRYQTCMKHFVGGIVLPNPFDRQIEQEFRKEHFDVIHVHHPILIGNTALYLSRKYHIPLTFTYHTRYEQYLDYYTGGILPSEQLMAFYLRSFLKRCDFVFAPTRGMEDYLRTSCHVPSEKTGILPTGLEQNSFSATPEECEAIRNSYEAENMPLFITVSRMAREKNVMFLIESLAILKASCQTPFKALFIGDGPDRESLELQSQDLGLKENVIFTGMIPNSELAAYYTAADAFLFASKTETQGIVLLEAFAGKTPVIAVHASGVKDIVCDGENGILTNEDAEEFAARIMEFLKNDEMRERLAENALSAGLVFREEAVARTAADRYNKIITAGKAWTQKDGKPISYSCS